jgi:signal transduction histidine kinase
MAKGYTPNVRWHQRRDGTLVFIEGVAYARWAEDSAFQGVFTIGQDITARLEAEAARLDEEAARREKEVSMREELAEQVHAATTELRNLSRRLLLVQEEERRRLALELHDEIGQVLTGLTFQIAAAQGNGGEATLDDVNVTVRGLTEQVRQLALNLRPQVLDRYGLLVAVQWHVERFQAATGITVHLQEHEVAQERYPPEVEIAAFRVVQEALTNIARYAEVQEARVTLISDNNLLLVINDHGRGFDPDEDRESSGVGGMRERVSLLGGSFVLETAPGQGVHITAEFPLDAGMQRNATEETAS